MLRISEITPEGFVVVAVGNPITGFHFEGQTCCLNYVLQQIESSGFMYNVEVIQSDPVENIQPVRKLKTIRVMVSLE